MKKTLTVLTVLLLLSSPTAFPQDFCRGDFDYDATVDDFHCSVLFLVTIPATKYSG